MEKNGETMKRTGNRFIARRAKHGFRLNENLKLPVDPIDYKQCPVEINETWRRC